MHAYLVRLKNNAELVGLFVSPSVEMLPEFVDECCNPYECDFVELPAGGLYLSAAGAATIPAPPYDPDIKESDPDWFSDATVSELWLEIFYDHKRKIVWQPIEAPLEFLT